MRLSIIIITCRPGGIDVLISGLSRQEFDMRDCEVIVVDALYSRRRELVADKFAQAKLRLVHVPPRQRIWPIDACPQARNAAIAKASGELLLFLVDFSFVPPKGLSEHWGVWEHFNKTKAGMGAHRYLYPPELAYTLPEYAPIRRFKPNEQHGVTYAYDEADSRAFARDIEAGVYDPHMYSVFHPPLEDPRQIEALSEDPYFFQVDPKLHGLVSGMCPADAFHAKNESVALDWCLRANGFEEGFTGHLYDDVSFGHHISRNGGAWMLLDPAATVQIVNPRHFFPHLVRLAPIEAHRPRYETIKGSVCETEARNSYQLSGMRGVCPWWY